MGRKIKETMLLLCVIIHLIGNICSLNCPSYEKHEAMREGLLNDRAICRAAKYGFEEKICLNGLPTKGVYCATESCILGYMCIGHCLTGDDNIDENNDNVVKCSADQILQEREKLCFYYKDQLKKHNKYLMETDENIFKSVLLPPGLVGLAVKKIYGYVVSQSIEENKKLACPEMGWAISASLVGKKNVTE